ncbi:MAG: molybdopterin molybdotransferase MoeA [Pseudorhodoplanes sp.]|nr:molybdopterin molybdotransferase MoeA [Pseudorhodoplanes sp.]
MALITVSDALARILEQAQPLGTEDVPLVEAHGRVLARDLSALRTQPPTDVSAMDGYAVRAADVGSAPASLALIGEVAAGHPGKEAVRPGEAARIFTGGVVPAGADTIVIQENTERDGDRVVVKAGAPAGKHIRRAGIDFAKGDLLLPRGRRLTGRDVMLAAAGNHALLPVYRQPHVAMFATGDELVMPGREPGPGQIVYSNGYALMALARAEGADVVDLGVVPDRMDETMAALRRAREAGADVLVTTGGASVGEYDLMHRAYTTDGFALSFWKVALRPGRPLMYGQRGSMRALGLPGNPVSAFVCAFLFLVPLIRVLTGRVDFEHPIESLPVGCDMPGNDGRADYMRATIAHSPDGREVVTPWPTQDSSLMRALAKADCLLIRPPNSPPAKAGDLCPVLKLSL